MSQSTTTTVSAAEAARNALVQQRRDALEFFQNAKNRTWPKLNAYKDKDRSWFPDLVHILATEGLISGPVLDKALDAAWFECGSERLLLPAWAELYNLANGAAAS